MYNRDIMEAVATPAKFTRKDIDLMDRFIKNGYFSTRSDLVRTSVRHYLHELSLREIRSKVQPQMISDKEIEQELKEIKKIRKDIWKKKYAKNFH